MQTPFTGDYVQLLNTQDQPSENFTLVIETKHDLTNGVFVISDLDGEDFAVKRNENFDTKHHKGWKQVILPTNTAPKRILIMKCKREFCDNETMNDKNFCPKCRQDLCPKCGKPYLKSKAIFEWVEYTHSPDVIIGNFALVSTCLDLFPHK